MVVVSGEVAEVAADFVGDAEAIERLVGGEQSAVVARDAEPLIDRAGQAAEFVPQGKAGCKGRCVHKRS